MNHTSLASLLTTAATESPSRTAIIDPGVGEVSYGELQTLVGHLTDILLSVGVGKNDRVGICAPKSIGTVAAIFASLSCKACHVPVDPGAPPQRSAYIFRDCAVKAILIDSSLVQGLTAELSSSSVTIGRCIGVPTPDFAGVDLQLLVLDEQGTGTADTPEGLAYILYTSGSTGNPKGVMHSHSTAFSFIDWCSDTFQPTREDRFSSHAPFHFDLSILDLYLSIKHQASLVLISEEVGKQPLLLAPLIAEQRISIWYSTPSILRLLVEYGELNTLDLAALRIVLYAGEVFPLKHLQSLCHLLPDKKFYNLYGPTETNVCTCYPLPTPLPDDESLPLLIGAVCSGDQARVVDEAGRDVAAGTEGELWIAGGSVHLGYWNLPEQNAKAFIVDEAGTQWYRTGDLVIDQGDGNFRFLGRRDRMVKRRGYRVELGEIESVLYSHPSISEAAVIALPDEERGVQLRAFIQWNGDEAPSILQLKRFAAENLLNYMIPDRFVFLDALPATSTDKIDYQRLRDM